MTDEWVIVADRPDCASIVVMSGYETPREAHAARTALELTGLWDDCNLLLMTRTAAADMLKAEA